MLRNTPIRRKVMIVLLLISGAVLLLTCMAFILYEFRSFRINMQRTSTTLAQVIANNATASLAFANEDDAAEILSALHAEPNVLAAALYDDKGMLFAIYPTTLQASDFPNVAPTDGYRFVDSFLIGVEPVKQRNNKRLGTLYLRLDQRAIYGQLQTYTLIALTMTAVVFLFAYLLSRTLQRQISAPILNLANTASRVAANHDYSIRAQKYGKDEVGSLTDAFNQMLAQIQEQDRAVRDSEARVRAVLDAALSAVILIDQNGKIIEWNPRAEQIFGWSRGEALGRDMADAIIPSEFREHHRQGMRRHREQGKGPVLNRLVELTALRRNGSEFPVELSISPLSSGTDTTFCGFVTDITERRQAAIKVQEQLARLDLLHRITRAIGERQDLKSIFQVVIRTLEHNLPIDFGCICLYSPAEQVLTVTSIGVNSRPLALELAMSEQARIPIDQNGLSRCVRGELVYEPDITDSIFPFPSRLAKGGLGTLVVAPLLAESKVFGVLVAARRIADGFSSGECEFLRQLSEHVALAAHQAQLYTDLQQAYDDLRHSQQLTLQQERLRALGQMASGVAHDINNAISPVTLYTESLLEREPNLSDRARLYLTTIRRAIDDVAHTVNRMREFYRPRESQLSFAPIDLNQIVLQISELTRAKWRDVPQQHGVVIDLHTELAAVLPEIAGAEHEIRDALTNLIFNAVDAMPDGGKLTIRTYVLPAGNPPGSAVQRVALEVTDTGIGMDEPTRRQCLEPFFTTKGERGTGMGLAMVYGMAQRHKAELQIDSAPGNGTTMRCLFTAAQVTTTARPLPVKPLHSLHILLVDDDPLIIEAMQEILRRDGHHVIAVDGGQAGIDAFADAQAQAQRAESNRGSGGFDVVITDLGMPHVDGRRVAAAIKALCATVPIIMLTGWGQRLLDDGTAPAHVDRVLSKPPKLEELRRAFTELITHAEMSPP